MSNNTIIFSRDATNTQIQMGIENSTQTIDQSFDSSMLQQVLDSINVYRSQLIEEFGDKSREMIDALDSAQRAVNNKDQIGWKKALSLLRDLLIGTGGSLVASGILGLLSKFM